MKRTYLGEFEEVVLLTAAVLALQNQAYGVAITVKSTMGDPTPERGGRRKRLFTVTAYGQRTLQEIQEVRSNLWDRLQSPLTPTLSV
jgi:hypothetical protein